MLWVEPQLPQDEQAPSDKQAPDGHPGGGWRFCGGGVV